MKITTFAQCMDVFDCHDATLYEYLTHILLSKIDAEQRVARALPHLIARAEELVAAYGDIYADEIDDMPA